MEPSLSHTPREPMHKAERSWEHGVHWAEDLSQDSRLPLSRGRNRESHADTHFPFHVLYIHKVRLCHTWAAVLVTWRGQFSSMPLCALHDPFLSPQLGCKLLMDKDTVLCSLLHAFTALGTVGTSVTQLSLLWQDTCDNQLSQRAGILWLMASEVSVHDW